MWTKNEKRGWRCGDGCHGDRVIAVHLWRERERERERQRDRERNTIKSMVNL